MEMDLPETPRLVDALGVAAAAAVAVGAWVEFGLGWALIVAGVLVGAGTLAWVRGR